MRLPILFLVCLVLVSCTGVPVVDDTWNCARGNVPEGKSCAFIPEAEVADSEEVQTLSAVGAYKGPRHSAATITKLPDKNEKTEYPLKGIVPPKTWGE